MMRIRHPTDIVEIIPDSELEDLDVFGEYITGVDKRGNSAQGPRRQNLAALTLKDRLSF